MLQNIRDNSQGVIAKVIIGLIVAIFVLFGAESIIGGLTRGPSVAEVNGEEITDFQLQQGVQDLINSIGGNAEGVDQALLEQIALNQLIEETLLRQAGDRGGLGISNARIDKAIIANPNFQVSGRFDSEFALRTMNSQGFSVQSYKEALNSQMLLSQLVSAITESEFAIKSELQTLSALSAQARDFRYISIPPGTRTLGTPISDEEIAEYYEANLSQFTRPESVAVDYVLLEKTALASQIELAEGAIEAQYEVEKAEFEGSAEKRASHILFETGPQMSLEAARAAASDVIARAAAGEAFEALAMELSSDRISAEEGGDIGFSDGSAFPPEIEEALVGLAVGDITEPVETDFGIHVVKLTEDNANVFQELEEVAGRIERELKAAEVEQLYASMLSDLSNLAFESSDLQRVSSELNLPILSSGAFDRSGGGGIFSDQAVLDAAFSFEVFEDGNNSDVVELGPDRALVLRVKTIEPEGRYSLDEVEPEIAVAIRGEMERDAVAAIGEEIISLIEQGGDLDALLESEELSWREEQSVRRGQSSINAEIVNAIFGLPVPDAGAVERSELSLANGTFVVAELTSVTEGDFASLTEGEQTAMRESIVSDLGSSEFRAYVATLREEGSIVINSDRQEELPL